MSITIATLKALLTLDTSGFTDGAEKASGAGDKLKGNMQSLGMAGIAGFAAAGTAAAGLLGYGVKIAADMEQAKIGFTTMLGSAEKADAFIKDLQAFAAKTPFEFAGLQESASKLLAVGVNAKSVIPLMTVLGDATSAVGTGAEGIDRAVMALSQMQQKGKVTGEEMLQLVEAGIPAWDALASKIGKSVPEAQDLVSAGQVKVNDLFAALEGRAGPALQRVSGMMDKQSMSLTGMLSSLKDTFDQQMATLTKPLVEGLKGALPSITEFVDKGVKAITPAVETASKALGSFFKTVTTGVTDNEESRTKIEDFALAIRNAFQWVIDNKDLVIASVVAIGTAWAGAMAMAAFETIAATWPLLLLVGALAAVIGIGIRVWNEYGDTISRVWNETIQPALQKVYDEVLYPIWQFMQEKWNLVWSVAETIIKKFGEAWPTIQQALLDCYNLAIKPVFEFIANNSEMFKNLGIVLAVVAAIIIGLVIVAFLAFVAAMVVFTVVAAVVVTIVVALIAVFMRLVNIIWDVFNNTRDALGGVIDKIEETIQFFWDLAQNVGSAIADAVRAVWNLWNGVRDMGQRVSDKLAEIAGWFIGLPGRIRDALGDLSSTLWGAGASLLEGLWNGISSKVEWLKGKVGGVLSSIRNLFPFSPAKEGPFSGRGYTSYSGMALAEDFAGGIAAATPVVLEAVKNLMSSARPEFDVNARGPLTGAAAPSAAAAAPRQMTVRFTGNTSDALATVIMGLIRSGQIQLEPVAA